MNFSKIFFLLKNLKKIQFFLKKKKIVVFDGYSLRHLQNILENYNYFVLEDRLERINIIYLNPLTLYYFFRYFFLIFSNYSLKLIYTIAIIKALRPKVVITSIDNSTNFFLISKILKKSIFFLAIQNNSRRRGGVDEIDYFIEKSMLPRNYKDIFYIPNYICFGQCDIDSTKRQNLQIEKFYNYGSIQIGNFFHNLRKNNIKLKKDFFDICFISEPVMSSDFYNFSDAIIKSLQFSIKISIENNLKFTFASKYLENSDESKKELKFYQKNLNDKEIEFLKKNWKTKKNIFSSYELIFQSKLAIGVQSSLLYGKIGCGEKILSCNFTSLEIYDFPIVGICSMKNPSYEDFQERVKKILSIDKKEYLQNIKQNPQYFINFDDKESIIDKTKKLIDRNLN